MNRGMKHSGWARAIASAALVMVVGCLVSGAAHADSPAQSMRIEDPVAAYQRMSGDLTVRHSQVRADGRATGLGVPAIVLHLDRQHQGGRWRTVLTVRETEPIRVRTLTGSGVLDNPFAVSRFEYDDDGAPPRMFNRKGGLVSPPGKTEREILGWADRLRDAEWQAGAILSRIGAVPSAIADRGPAAGLIARADESHRRREQIEARFGRAVGQHDGLDRFVSESGEAVHELLADSATSLPIEINIARSGRLVSRALFTYEPAPGGELLRRSLRSERALDVDGGTRLVSEIELGNVMFNAEHSR